MKNIRPINLVKCSLCGKEADKLTMYEIFTGRVRYVCRECRIRGNKEIDARVGTAIASKRARIEKDRR